MSTSDVSGTSQSQAYSADAWLQRHAGMEHARSNKVGKHYTPLFGTQISTLKFLK